VQFRSHKGAMFGLITLGILIVAVLIGPSLWVPEKLSVAQAIKLKNQGPSFRFPLGTDQVGRDMLARMLLAGRISLAVGMVAMAIAIIFGTLIGILAGYFRRLDGPLMRLTDMFLALPLVPLLLVMVMLFRDRIAGMIGPELGAFALIVFAIGITSWMATARIVRGEVLTLKEREYVLAARSIGARPNRIILRHILPNVISPVMVAATLGVAEAIITESVLSFLGLGFPPDFPTWGRLLYDGLQYMQVYPERVVWPGLAISLTVLSVNYIGDGLRDALDPRIRGR
jgi:peptide/nickel transport system permease protein